MNDNLDGYLKGFLADAQRNPKIVRLVALTVAVLVLFSILSPNAFLSGINFQTIGFAVPEIALLGLAMMVAMTTGGIDLSVVSTANLAALTIAWLFQITGNVDATGGSAVALTLLFSLAGMAVGVVAGMFNALLISVLKIAPILATLGTMLLYNGLAIVWTGGKVFYGMPAAFMAIGNDTLAGIPISLIVLLVLCFVLSLVMRRMALGLKFVFVGANTQAALYSGIKVSRVLFSTYMLTGLLAAMAGIIIASRSASASADYGASYVLLAIVIAVLGGTDPNGGYGTVFGTLIASIVLQVVSSGFNVLHLSPFEYTVAQGVILVGVMVLDSVKIRWPWRNSQRQTRKVRTDHA